MPAADRTGLLLALLLAPLGAQAPLEFDPLPRDARRGLPLGDGWIGALLHADGGTLRLALDRNDLWAGQRLPAGSVAIACAPQRATLDLRRAEAVVTLPQGEVRLFCSANRPMLLLRASPALGAVRLDLSPESERGEDAGVSWCARKLPDGRRFALVHGRRERAGGEDHALVITSADEPGDPVSRGRERVAAALRSGYVQEFGLHVADREAVWDLSQVQVPNPKVQAQYDLAKYLLLSTARASAPAIGPQGVWCAAVAGDPAVTPGYRCERTLAFCYQPVLTAGYFELELGLLTHLSQLLPVFTAPVLPAVMGIDGKALVEVAGAAARPASTVLLVHQFWLHWRFTRQQGYLETIGYPFCSQVGEAMAGLARAGADRRDATDLALLRALYLGLGAMAEDLGKRAEADRWRQLLAGLPELPLEQNGALATRTADAALAIQPLGLLDVAANPAQRKTVLATLTSLELGDVERWSPVMQAWHAALCGRAGLGDNALAALQRSAGSIGRNGFALDPTGNLLEAPLVAMQAVHELLLHSFRGVVHVFPAVPGAWHEVAFRDLRAIGGLRVSAERHAGVTTRIEIVAGADGLVRLLDPFGDDVAEWSLPDGKRFRAQPPLLEVKLVAGERIVGRRRGSKR